MDCPVGRECLYHYCDYCNKKIIGEVFVNFIAGYKYHYHYECYKIEIEMLKKGGDSKS